MEHIPSYEEKELFSLISASDEQAFARLFRIYVPVLQPFVFGIVKSDALVDEVIQESFVRIWMNRDQLSAVEYPKAYLYRLVSFVCFHYLRRKTLQQTTEQVAFELTENSIAGKDIMAMQDLEELVRQAMSRLTPAQQKIYRLSREQGLKIPEIAEQLNISPNTVKNTLVTSLRSIRQFLEAAGYMLGIWLFWYYR